MLSKKKKKLKDILDTEFPLSKESPFGMTEEEFNPKIPKKKLKVLRMLYKLQEKKNKKEVVMLPDKTTSDSPKVNKLKALPKDAEVIQKDLSNLVKIPKKQLDNFMEIYAKSSKKLSSEFLERIAPVFLSYEDAMNYSTVALRDGLSYDGTIDFELIPLLEWATRIATLEIFLENLKMPKETKDRFINLTILKAIDKAFSMKSVNPFVPSSVDNKVAGIVTPLGEIDRKNLENLKKLADLSKRVKHNYTDTRPVAGVMKKKSKR